MQLWAMRVCGNFRWTVVSPLETRSDVCQAHPALAAWVRDRSITLEIQLQRLAPDFIGHVGVWLISEQVRRVLMDSGITGVEFLAAECWAITDRGMEPLQYWEMDVRGWGGLANPASGVRILEHCPLCGMTWFSPITSGDNLFNPHDWDGSDCFRIWPGGEFVTDRFRDVIERHGFTGVRFITLKEDIESDLKNPAIANPRCAGLRHWYTKDEAEKLKGAMMAW